MISIKSRRRWLLLCGLMACLLPFASRAQAEPTCDFQVECGGSFGRNPDRVCGTRGVSTGHHGEAVYERISSDSIKETCTCAYGSCAYSAEEITRGQTAGRIPALQIGPWVGGGLGRTTEPSDILFGPKAAFRIQAKPFLLYGEALWTPVHGNVAYALHAGAVLGFWSTLPLYQPLQDCAGGPDVYECTTYVSSEELPVVVGLALGAGVLGKATDANRSPVVLEAGLAAVSGQFEVFAAPLWDVNNGSPGVRWSVYVAFPFGKLPLGLRFEGEHVVGQTDSSPVVHVLGLAVTLGTSFGISVD